MPPTQTEPLRLIGLPVRGATKLCSNSDFPEAEKVAHFGAMTDEVKDTRKCPGQGRRELFFCSARRLLAQTATWLEEAVNPLLAGEKAGMLTDAAHKGDFSLPAPAAFFIVAPDFVVASV